MDFSTKTATADQAKVDAVAVGIFADGTLTPAARRIDAAAQGAVRALLRTEDFSGKRGTAVVLRDLGGVAARRVILVGLGAADELGDRGYVEAIRTAVKAAGPGVRTLGLAAFEWGPRGRDSRWLATQAVIAGRDAVFRTDELKSRRDAAPVPRSAQLLSAERDAGAARGVLEGTATAHGMELAKRLGNLPPNVCTPSYLATQARELGRQHRLTVQVLDGRQIQALKMGAFLSVARGSDEPPRFIVMRHAGGGPKAAPVVLVGKGITFDSGGISIKPGAAMDEMKFDMCGAASVFGAMQAVAELKLKLNVVGVVPACENLPSGRANRPGDIVTSMSGQTIEVLNTDAEGRLILCDALTWAERLKPAAVIDIATLTGACVVALGNVNTGLFSPDDELAAELARAAAQGADPAWRLPIDEAYQEQLKSNFADMANIGLPGNAGAPVAASFLARFTKAYRWAHLDIAGTAWRGGAAKGATGRPVPLLVQFLLARAG